MTEKPQSEMIERRGADGQMVTRGQSADSNSIGGETAIGNDNATHGGDGKFKPAQVDMAKAAEMKVSRLHGKALRLMVTLVAGTGFTLFGYDQGVMSALLTLPSFEAAFPQTAGGFGGSNSATLQSLLVAIYEIGCLFGALSNLFVGDRLGRRYTIALGGVIMVVGAILQTAAVDYAMMLVARVVTGVGNGLLTSTVPAYQAECAKPAHRGQLVLVEGSLITFGVMISYWVDLGFYFTDGSISWRFPIALQIVFALIMLGCLFAFRLCESPRWLASKGRYEESLAVLAALEGTAVDDKEVQRTFQGICDAIAIESSTGFSMKELLTHGRSQNFRRTMLGIGAQWFQQISGINLITYYLTSVLTDMGLGAEMSRIISGVNGTTYFLTSIIAIFIIERAGRRPLMLWMAAFQAVTMAVLAGLYDINKDGNKAAQVISVLCLFLFNTWFSIGWLGMTWLYPAEITPLRVRAQANALSTAANWLGNFTIVMATGPMFAGIGKGTYIVFAATNAVWIWPTVYFFFPETKKYSLEELDLIFAIAHVEGKSPVAISKSSDIPAAGSPEAEAVLGRERPEGLTQKRSRRGSIGRIVSREKPKQDVRHSENV